MTGTNAPAPQPTPDAGARADGGADDDQTMVSGDYGHGRMPTFMKLAWLAAVVFMTWYVAAYLLPAAGEELSR